MHRRDAASPDGSTPGLSIIIPFHNSQYNSARLLATLASLHHQSLEVICVDDGSTDGTAQVLADFAATCQMRVQVLSQENSGPGTARNNGLRHARGQYVWFVDCDDDIRVEAIDHFLDLRAQGFDFVDFDMDIGGTGRTDTMGVTEGDHAVTSAMTAYLVGRYGAICTKITRRELLIANEIWYPEYCYYEDNVLGSVLPFFIERFHKAGIVGYLNHLEFESITRQKVGGRYFDRLHTAAWGLEAGSRLARDDDQRAALEARFIDLFLINTTNQIFGLNFPDTGFLVSLRNRRLGEAVSRFFAHITSLWFARSWLLAARVHRYYREIATTSGVSRHPLTRLKPEDRAGRVPWRRVWISSFLLGSQREYFQRLRTASWGLDASDFPVWAQPQRPAPTAD